jgi:hypothetical protein
MDTKNIAISLPANAGYHCGISAYSLTINGFISNTDDGAINHYSIIFKIDDEYATEEKPFIFNYPDNVKWAGINPIFESGRIYKISFIKTIIDDITYYLGDWVVYTDAN